MKRKVLSVEIRFLPIYRKEKMAAMGNEWRKVASFLLLSYKFVCIYELIIFEESNLTFKILN